MPKIGVREERKRRLSASARKVIAAKGAVSATLRDVAEDAGLSTGIVSYYFRGKRDLLCAAVRSASAVFERHITTLAANATTPWERLEAYIAAVFAGPPERCRQDLAFWAECWSEAARADDVRLVHREHFQAWRDRLASIIADGQRSGVMDSSHDANSLALFIACVVDGLWLHSVIDAEAVPAEGTKNLALSLIQRALGTGDG